MSRCLRVKATGSPIRNIAFRIGLESLRFSARPAAAIRAHRPRSAVRVGGGRSPVNRLGPTRIVMQPKQAIAWMKKCGIAVESARASIPSLAYVVAGAPIPGSWWAHPKGKDIFRLSRVIRRSPDVLVCRLVDGKITYVHRRMRAALVSLAGRFSKQRLSALNEEHTPAGQHKLFVNPFSHLVPD